MTASVRQPTERTAWHEAGHAVAAVLYQLPFTYVTVRAFGDSLGHITVPFDQTRSSDVRYCEHFAVMTACGPAAEQLVSGERSQWYAVGAAGDLRDVDAILVHLVGGGSALSSAHRQVWEAAEEIVRKWEPAIARVAATLVERRTLVRATVRDVLITTCC
ncbi:MAG TPA: hypothetical protein VF102_07140 [Gemmatimonadaceae bacterium]